MPTTCEQLNCYRFLLVLLRLWMRDVLQPLNEKAAVIIFDHIDLLDVEHVVPELLQMVAHVATMRVMLKR
jgi:hypothetical protein